MICRSQVTNLMPEKQFNMSEILTTKEYLTYLEDFITKERLHKINSIIQQRTNHLTVVAEDVYQLHNTSAVLRSCDVFGIQQLHIIEQKYGKNIDSEIALGAQKWVDVYRYNNPISCVRTLKKQGYKIIIASPHHQALTSDDIDISKPLGIFFGNEKNGVSKEVMDFADGYLYIPMFGFTESLNISVAAAIIMHNLTQRLRKSTIPWELSEAVKLKTKIKWIENSVRSLNSIQKKYLEKYEY